MAQVRSDGRSRASPSFKTTAAATRSPHSGSGTPTTATGTVSYARATPGSETITVGSSTATVNWAPTEVGTGNINFLPVNALTTSSGGALTTMGQVTSAYQDANNTQDPGGRLVQLGFRINW